MMYKTKKDIGHSGALIQEELSIHTSASVINALFRLGWSADHFLAKLSPLILDKLKLRY